MRRLLLTAILVTASVSSAFSQACTQTAAATKIRGLQLGMTESQVLRLYPKLRVQREDEKPGQTYIHIEPRVPADNQLGDAGRGLSELIIIFLDHRLARAEFSYENVGNWTTVGAFTDAVATPIGLPAAAVWTPSNRTMNDRLRINCIGITFLAYTEWHPGQYESAYPSLTMMVPDYDQEIVRRTKAAEDAKRRAFKP